jgi:hypothetical protein
MRASAPNGLVTYAMHPDEIASFQRVKILRRSLRAYTELASDRFKELLAMGSA